MSKNVEDWAMQKILEDRKESARKMIARGKLTLEEIAEDASLPLEVVEELAELQPV